MYGKLFIKCGLQFTCWQPSHVSNKHFFSDSTDHFGDPLRRLDRRRNKKLILDASCQLMNEDFQELDPPVCKGINAVLKTFFSIRLLLQAEPTRSPLIQFPISCFKVFCNQCIKCSVVQELFRQPFHVVLRTRELLPLHVWLPYCHTCYSCHIQLYVLQTF